MHLLLNLSFVELIVTPSGKYLLSETNVTLTCTLPASERHDLLGTHISLYTVPVASSDTYEVSYNVTVFPTPEGYNYICEKKTTDGNFEIVAEHDFYVGGNKWGIQNFGEGLTKKKLYLLLIQFLVWGNTAS